MIRKAFFTAMFSAVCAFITIAAENPDTIKIVERPKSVTVITDGNVKTIKVKGSKDNPEFRYEYKSTVIDTAETTSDDSSDFNLPFFKKTDKKKKISTDWITDIYVGAVIPTAADRGFSTAGWEIGMLGVVRGSYRLSPTTELSIGLGWQYSRLPLGAGMRYETNAGNLSAVEIPDDMYKVKSSLRSFKIRIPVLLYQSIYKDFGFDFGAVVDLNTYTTAKSSWNKDADSHKTTFKGLHQRILTVDALLRIGLRGSIAAYVRYSPMSMFKEAHGPQFDAVAIGVSLGF